MSYLKGYCKETMKLLSRKEFKESVFKRDSYQCIFCENPAKDAHHIVDRKLFEDGGYYLNNGASLCEKHHWESEMTLISCEDIRNKIGITKIVLPSHFLENLNYDKWGNIILENGTRKKGELFYEKGVQKVLSNAKILNLFNS